MPRASNVLEIVINGTNKAGPALKRAGSELVKFGSIAVTAFAGASFRASQFEEGLAEISTLLDGEVTEAIAGMREELLDLSVEFGQTIGKLTRARYDVISAGFTDAAESAEVLEASSKLAVAGVSDVATAADLLTTAINGLGLEAKHATGVADILFQTVRRGKTRLDVLASSFGQVFASAKVAGVRLDELGAVMAATTARGIETTESATALNNLLRALAAPTGAAKAALQDLGITLDRGLINALDQLSVIGQEGLDKLTELIPNIRALKAAAAASADVEGLRENLAAMADAAGVTDDAFAKMQDTMAAQMQQARASIDALVITIGTAVLPTFRAWIERITRVVELVRNNKDAVFELSTQLFNMAVTAINVGLVLLSLQKAFVILNAAAAMTSKQLVIVVGGIATLSVAVAGINQILTELGYEVDIAGKTFGFLRDQVDKVAKEFPLLGEMLDALSLDIDDNTESVKDNAEAFKDLLTDIGDGPTLVADLKDNVQSGTDSFKQMRDEMRKLAEFGEEDIQSLAFQFGNNLASEIQNALRALVGLTDQAIVIPKIIARMAIAIVADIARIVIQMQIASMMADRYAAKMKAARAAASGPAGGGGGGGVFGMIGGVLGLLGGPTGSMIGSTVGGVIDQTMSTGGRVRGAAGGLGLAGGMVLPGTVGLDSTLVLASGGEHFTPAPQVNFAERMLQKTLTSPKRQRRPRKQKVQIDLKPNRPFRREEQTQLVDSTSEAFERARRYGRRS